MSSILGLLSMCRKAGRLELGMDPSKDAVYGRHAQLVCVAEDLSPKSLKEIRFFCMNEDVPIYKLGVTMDEVGSALGKRAGIIAVCDSGFSKKVRNTLELLKPDYQA